MAILSAREPLPRIRIASPLKSRVCLQKAKVSTGACACANWLAKKLFKWDRKKCAILLKSALSYLFLLVSAFTDGICCVPRELDANFL